VALLAASCTGANPTPSASSVSIPSSLEAPAAVSPAASAVQDIGTARLEGKWTISRVYTIVEHASDHKVGERETRIYTITPQCPTGPCDLSVVSFNPVSKVSLTILLKYSAGAYVYGPASRKNLPNEFYCVVGGKKRTDATDTYTLTVKVIKAAPLLATGAPVATEISLDGVSVVTWPKKACNTSREVTSGIGKPG